MADPLHRLRLVNAGCTRCGGDQGRGCLCRHPDLSRETCTELDLEIPHDPVRTFSPTPPRQPRVHRRTVAIAAGALIAFGLLLCASKHFAEPTTFTLLVGR